MEEVCHNRISGQKEETQQTKTFFFPLDFSDSQQLLKNQEESEQTANWPIGFDINEIYSVRSVIVG